QLGVPDQQLALDDPMYEGCIVMALIATHGELLDYVLDLVGADLFNFTDGMGGNTTFMAQQFPFGTGGLDTGSIFDMLGTDFSLLINVFFDLTDADAQTNMAAIRTHLHTNFLFDFEELINLRIDEEFIEGIVGEPVTLPFTGINLFIYKVTNEFENAVDSVLGVMDQSGFMASIDSAVFSEARASGAGLLAVPDMGNLMDLIEGFGGGGNVTPTSFLLSQMPALDGPVAIAAAGYIGDQRLSTNSDSLDIFEELLGKPSTGVVNGLTNGRSLVAAYLPENMNLTSYAPENQALNITYYDPEARIVFWNATAYVDVPDYSLYFDAGTFPPLVTITRSFDPQTTIPGGSTQVTVSVHNQGTEPIYDLNVTDTMIGTTYPASVNVSGTQSASATQLAPGEMLNITYTVTFQYEGVYAFAPAYLDYSHGNNTYSKHTHIDGYIVSPDPIGLIEQMFWDGYPYTALLGGGVVLGAIVNIALMARGKGGGTYQV
ncbi:MAG: CARDB domain-containing protein, partial [Candidatus Thorarchaeota archaeon]